MTSFDALNEYEIAQIMKQIFSAVHYCHALRIVHRDLKPENILFADDKPSLMLKVIDFGRSKLLRPLEKVNELAGTVVLSVNSSCTTSPRKSPTTKRTTSPAICGAAA